MIFKESGSTNTLFLLFLQTIFATATVQQESSSLFLPKPGECGQLKEQYLYNSERITAVDEFPWIARVKFMTAQQQNNYNCLAVLISRRHLLANARFFQDGTDYENIAIELGAWNSARPDCDMSDNCAPAATEHEIADIAVHPNFTEDSTNSRLFYNDIAVVCLRKEVTFNAYTQPLCLPESLALNNNVARYLPYTGFPRSSSEGTKRVKNVARVMNSKSCSRRLENLNITEGLMCAVSDLKAVPLLYGSALMGVAVENAEPQHFYLIGLLSVSGAAEQAAFTSDIFVRVATYVDWIKFNMY